MIKHLNKSRPSRQSGAALMALILVLFISASSVIVRELNVRVGFQETDADTRKEMINAKETLIAYAGNFAELNSSGIGPGRLPCSDYTNDGVADTAYCGTQYTYRLPEATTTSQGTVFNFSDAYAGIGQQFWYAISPAFRDSGVNGLNSGTSGALTLDGEPGYVAVIIAPGSAVTNQDRSEAETWAGNYYGLTNYLEGNNGMLNTRVFENAVSVDSDFYNDVVIGITHSEIMTPVTARVVKEMKTWLDFFHPHPFFGNAYPTNASGWGPYLAQFFGADWYEDDNWVSVANYNRLSGDIATISFTGCSIVYTVEFGGGISKDRTSC